MTNDLQRLDWLPGGSLQPGNQSSLGAQRRMMLSSSVVRHERMILSSNPVNDPVNYSSGCNNGIEGFNENLENFWGTKLPVFL